jgi:hypothetical protein
MPNPREVSMQTNIVGALCAIAMVASANAAIREEPVNYTDGEATMKGFVVYDDAIEGKRPGIVMVPEWWGITKHVQNEARKFAQQGYTVFIADMYGDAKTADNPKDAGVRRNISLCWKDMIHEFTLCSFALNSTNMILKRSSCL